MVKNEIFLRSGDEIKALTEQLLSLEREILLAQLYRQGNIQCQLAIGKLCDEELDPSGALLGRVRNRASQRSDGS